MDFLCYLPFGLIPSLIWLYFYLRKDPHPEPRDKILKVFFWGMTAAIAAGATESLILTAGNKLAISGPLFYTLYISLGIAIIEETAKYLVIRIKILKDWDFDEAVDAMEYMIIAALGFAALENVLLFFSEGLAVKETLIIACLRFIGATLLHALCSGIVGFFIVRGEFKKHLVFLSLIAAIILHAVYNFSIMEIQGNLKFLLPLIILGTSGIFVSRAFNKLKELN